MSKDSLLESLVTAVLASPKYQHVAPDLVRQVGQRELAARRNLKEATKATKNKLHQAGGAYFEAKIDYDQALAMLRAAAPANKPRQSESFRAACRNLMRLHASTQERLAILPEFYATTLADLEDIRIVIDVACGLNPLALPWMALPDDVEYTAYDIYGDMMSFVQGFFDIAGVRGRAEVRDVVGQPPAGPADLALILKALPCLEQIDKVAAVRLLDTIQARYLLVSFPVRSLGGRGKGMIENYDGYFHNLIAGRTWKVKRFEFATELAFLVETQGECGG